jgi:O-antigen/teichoic acid export membrane protein
MNKEIKIPLVLLGLNTSSYLINYSLNVILARHLSAHIYGDYSVAIKVLTIMVELALFGTQVGTKRFLAKYLDLNR